MGNPSLIQSGRWPLYAFGMLLFVLGPAFYAIQFYRGNLAMPWQMPILASVGVVLMAVSVWQQGGILRGLGLALFVLLCGFEWAFVLVLTKTPAYAGPADIGQKVPAFTTTRADGNSFTSDDLANGKPTLLLFFRGRW